MEYHVTKVGRKVKISDLETDHLLNILRLIERRAKEGVIIRVGGGATAEDIWYDEATVYGEEAKNALNFYEYNAELERRGVDITSKKKY